MNIKDRILLAAQREGLTPGQLEKRAGLSNGYFRSIKNSPSIDKLDKIMAVLTNVSREWIEHGDDVVPSSIGNNININGNSNSTISTGNIVQQSTINQPHESDNEDGIPVIPMEMYAEPDTDVYEVIHSDEYPIRISPVIKQFSSYDTYYVVYGEEMAPYFLPGDKLGIRPYNKGDEHKLVGGRTYVINTKTNGMLLRTLYSENGGFRAVAYNSRYADVFIEDNDVIRVFCVLGLIRTSI